MPMRLLVLSACLCWCAAAEAESGQPTKVPTSPLLPAPAPAPPAPAPQEEPRLPVAAPKPAAEPAPWPVERIAVSLNPNDGGWITLEPVDRNFRLEWGATSEYLSVTNVRGEAISYSRKSGQDTVKFDNKDVERKYITVAPTSSDVNRFRLRFKRQDLKAVVGYQALLDPTKDPQVELRRVVSISNPSINSWNCEGCQVEVRSLLTDPTIGEPVPLGDGSVVSPQQVLAVALKQQQKPEVWATGKLFLPFRVASSIPEPHPEQPFKVEPVPIDVQLDPLKKTGRPPVLPPGTPIGVYHRHSKEKSWEWQVDAEIDDTGYQFFSALLATPVAVPLELVNGRLTYDVIAVIGNPGKPQTPVTTRRPAPRTLRVLLESAEPTSEIRKLNAHLTWLLGKTETGQALAAGLDQILQTDQQIEAVLARIQQAAFDSSTLPAGERDRLISTLRRDLTRLRNIRVRQIDAYNALAMGTYRFGDASNVVPPPAAAPAPAAGAVPSAPAQAGPPAFAVPSPSNSPGILPPLLNAPSDSPASFPLP